MLFIKEIANRPAASALAAAVVGLMYARPVTRRCSSASIRHVGRCRRPCCRGRGPVAAAGRHKRNDALRPRTALTDASSLFVVDVRLVESNCLSVNRLSPRTDTRLSTGPCHIARDHQQEPQQRPMYKLRPNYRSRVKAHYWRRNVGLLARRPAVVKPGLSCSYNVTASRLPADCVSLISQQWRAAFDVEKPRAASVDGL